MFVRSRVFARHKIVTVKAEGNGLNVSRSRRAVKLNASKRGKARMKCWL